LIAYRSRAVIRPGGDVDSAPRGAASRRPNAKHDDSRRPHRKPAEQLARLGELLRVGATDHRDDHRRVGLAHEQLRLGGGDQRWQIE
jgi:hypothetical protein